MMYLMQSIKLCGMSLLFAPLCDLRFALLASLSPAIALQYYLARVQLTQALLAKS
jgi:hypothetical protein